MTDSTDTLVANRCRKCSNYTKYQFCYNCHPIRCTVCDCPVFNNSNNGIQYSHCYLCFLEEKYRKMHQELKSLRQKINNEKKMRPKYRNGNNQNSNQNTINKPKKFIISCRKSIPKVLKNQVWDSNIGKCFGVGECYCCGILIDSKNFEAGHIISVANGGESTLNNLKPICSCCNKSMSTENLEDFKQKYMKKRQ